MKKLLLILGLILCGSSAYAADVSLYWTAPGDDGTVGTAASYDVRWSLNPITPANWGSATPVTGEPTPAVFGTTQSMVLTGLASKTVHFVAMTAADSAGNISAISNVISFTTPDDMPPSTIVDLRTTP